MRYLISGLLAAGLLLSGCGHTLVPISTACWEFKEPADPSTRSYRLVGLCANAPGASTDYQHSIIPHR